MNERLLRIIDKNGNFLRDDFVFDAEIEIGLDVDPAVLMYRPKRIGFEDDPEKGTQWIEGATQAEIDEIIARAAAEPIIIIT